MTYRTISADELKTILAKHKEWLADNSKGERANLSSADLSSADLSSADLRWANLRSADLSSADLSSADLRSADLRWADLSWANLSSADLSSADLRWANLSSADLRSANLSWANLSSANLSSADILIFQYQRHVAYFTNADGMLRIGCHFMPISEWVIGHAELGKEDGYTEIEIKMYGAFINQCAELFKGSK